MSAPAERPSAPLGRNRDFRIVWVVQTLSQFGDSFALLALPLLVLQATGSVTQMGALTAVGTMGAVCTGIAGAGLADRWDRRRVMIVCDLVRLLLYASIPVAWRFGPQPWILYVVALFAGSAGMLFHVCYTAAVPSLVGRDQLVAANGRLEASSGVAYVLGPMLAGICSSLFGPTAAIALNAVTFAVSGVGLGLVRLRDESTRARSRTNPGRRAGGFRAGWSFVWQDPLLRALVVLGVPLTFVSLGLTDVYIYHLRHNLDASTGMVGAVLGVASVGAIVGALLAPVVQRRIGFGRSWIGAHAVCGVAVITTGLTTTLGIVAATAGAFVFAGSIVNIVAVSLRQRITPDELMGRVGAVIWTLHGALGAAGAAALTLAVAHLGVAWPVVAAGSGFVLVAIAATRTPVATTR